MKVLLCVHGLAPLQLGGTERSAAALAHQLADAGHAVLVIAGSCEPNTTGELTIERHDQSTRAGNGLRIERWTRPDLYFDHWHKSRSAQVAEAFRETLRRERPDLVHVFHWLRLTRELVAIAAQEGAPSVVSLGDSWITCPLTFRVRPETGQVCETPLSGASCIACAGQVAPRTPWVSLEAGYMELAARSRDLELELRLAGARLVPSQSFGERLQAGLGAESERFEFEVLAPCAAPAQLCGAVRPPARATGEPLRLGSWGQVGPLKGTDLIFEAIAGLEHPECIEWHLAGPELSPGYLRSLQQRYPAVQCTWHGAYEASELAEHPVTRVHAMLSASRAPESFGIVLEEARALGLPAILPELGAFAERGGEEVGATLFRAGDAGSLRAVLSTLCECEGQLERLARRVPAALTEASVCAAHLALYERVIEAGSPSAPPAQEWYAERMASFAQEEWDRALCASSPQELGFADGEDAN